MRLRTRKIIWCEKWIQFKSRVRASINICQGLKSFTKPSGRGGVLFRSVYSKVPAQISAKFCNWGKIYSGRRAPPSNPIPQETLSFHRYMRATRALRAVINCNFTPSFLLLIMMMTLMIYISSLVIFERHNFSRLPAACVSWSREKLFGKIKRKLPN